MSRARRGFHFLLIPLLALMLAACTDRQADDTGAGDRPVPTPEPTPTEVANEATPTTVSEPTEPADNGESGDWYELLVTDKNYPEAETGEQLLELAESDAELQELWDWFELGSEQEVPDINWDTSVVLFAGTGESSGCPLIIEFVEFDDDERLIEVATTRDVPEDTMCTMDWTPRVFVLALDRETLGDDELRAAIYDTEIVEEIDPANAVVVRDSNE